MKKPYAHIVIITFSKESELRQIITNVFEKNFKLLYTVRDADRNSKDHK